MGGDRPPAVAQCQAHGCRHHGYHGGIYPDAAGVWRQCEAHLQPTVCFFQELSGSEHEPVGYTLIPSIAYFEFLPWRNSQQDGSQGNWPHNTPEAIKLADVKVGEEYELLVTNYAGLYRYRVGDILRCTGYYNKAPSFYFVGRANAAPSVDFDKTTDRHLHNAITKASQHLQDVGLQLRDYSSFADTQSKPAGHYVIFWEVSERDPWLPWDLLDNCCGTMEQSFDYVYRVLRNSPSINPLELRIVKGPQGHSKSWPTSP